MGTQSSRFVHRVDLYPGAIRVSREDIVRTSRESRRRYHHTCALFTVFQSRHILLSPVTVIPYATYRAARENNNRHVIPCPGSRLLPLWC